LALDENSFLNDYMKYRCGHQMLIYQLMRRQLSMGRTIPSHRMASVEERKEWKGFRQALDKSDRKTFDEI